MQRYKYENLLFRMEAMRAPLNEGAEPELDWTLEIDRNDENTVVLTGHLYRIGESGFGQALVISIIRDSNDEEILHDLEYLSEWAQDTGCIESMYDACRRSINSQASLMDFDPELPVKAPESVVKVAKPEEVG